eukprot:m.5435 g.5435  ORF g.5435 m.5435 type:complete len:66 (+) comp4240_c0_seq1:192-389(+)
MKQIPQTQFTNIKIQNRNKQTNKRERNYYSALNSSSYGHVAATTNNPRSSSNTNSVTHIFWQGGV